MNKIITQNQKNIKRYLPHEIKTDVSSKSGQFFYFF